MCHSLRGVVKVQVFVVMDFWKGCNCIGTVNLKVPLLILKLCPSLDIQLRSGVCERAAGRVHAKGFVDLVANCL